MPFSNPIASPNLERLFSLQGRTALVTGGAGFLGSEIAFALAELGANLIIASRDRSHCTEFVKHLMSAYPENTYHALTLDITDTCSVTECVKSATGEAGGFDILVNCSWSGNKNTFESISETDWLNDVDVSLNGVFRMIKAAFPVLSERRGVILNVASMYGYVAPDHRLYDGKELANPPSYGASKAGVIQLTKYLASFLAPHGIRVNCLSPGPFPYESTQREYPDFVQRLGAKNPLGRIGKPYELRGVAALLCSDASSYMTGQNICVDGGWGIW